MIIEFVGIQGAGKSTIAQLLALKINAQLLPGLDSRPATLIGRWRTRAMDFLRSPKLALAGFKHLYNIQSIIVLARLCRYDRYRRKIEVSLGQITLLEEGAVHGLARFATHNRSALELVIHLKFPTLMILVDTKPEVALTRIRNRDSVIDINKFSKEAALSALTERGEVLKKIVHSNSAPYLLINGMDSPEKCCDKIISKLFFGHVSSHVTANDNIHDFATESQHYYDFKKGRAE